MVKIEVRLRMTEIKTESLYLIIIEDDKLQFPVLSPCEDIKDSKDFFFVETWYSPVRIVNLRSRPYCSFIVLLRPV